MRNDVDIGGYHRGYEPLRAQNFEKQTKGDLKEGFYFGKDLPMDDPYVVAGKFSQGPNKYPHEARDSQLFRKIMDTYHTVLSDMAEKILQL
jgi:isopenicillin N synthase-like dioxygenase